MDKIELKTRSLKEILNKCEKMGWDISHVFLDYELWEHNSEPDNPFVRVFMKKKKIKKG